VIVGALLALAGSAVASSTVFVGRRWARVWLALTLVGALAGMGAALFVLGGAGDWEWRPRFALGREPLHLRLDAISALFLIPVCVVGGMGAAYAREYWSDHHRRSAARGRAWWSVMLMSLALVLTASNGLLFLAAWEAMALSSFFLITLERRRADVRAAGWLYIVASHAGTLALFAFFALLAARTGGWDLGPHRGQADLAPLFWLALVGFGVKAGGFPLHVWLPSAHANAPSHVSAMLSGVGLKMGIYGIVRFSGWSPVPAAAGWVLLAAGAASALIGIVFAFAQTDVKRLLAYCSIENVGVILVGLGAALLAVSHADARWGQLAMAGALFHVWNHAAFKTLLFFGAGSVLHATGTRDMSRSGGLWRAMPWTAAAFAVGAAAVSGLPPLNGFVSEWLVYVGLFDAATASGPTGWGAALAALVLATAGAVTLATFVKAGAMIFLGAPRTQPAARAQESGNWMRGPMVAMAATCAALGLLPALVWPAISRAAGAWHPAWGAPEAPAALATLGGAQVMLAAVLVLTVGVLWRRVRALGVRRSLTWDCAYVAPTARMQYSAGSFAAIAVGWFSWLLLPARAWRRPRGPLPSDAQRIERIPDLVLAHVVGPVGGLIMRFAVTARRAQHGRLQSYILYVLAGLTVLGALVVLGGPR
jgi:hydrogenase-4 component B